MICPHCNKEIDGYVGIKTEDINLNLNNGCAGGVLSYTYTVNNVAAASPIQWTGNSTPLNVAGCANQGALNTHYHTF